MLSWAHCVVILGLRGPGHGEAPTSPRGSGHGEAAPLAEGAWRLPPSSPRAHVRERLPPAAEPPQAAKAGSGRPAVVSAVTRATRC